MEECPICSRPLLEVEPTIGDRRKVTCPICGTFEVSGTALTLLEGMERQERELQLAFAKRNADEGATPYIRNIIE